MRRFPLLLTLTLLLTGGVGLVQAQDETRAATLDLQDLYEMLQEQQKLLEHQALELDSQKKEIAQQAAELTTQREALMSLTTKLDQTRQDAGISPTRSDEEIRMMERLASLEKEVQKEPDDPASILRAGDFPGSIRLPGTNMAAKVGGNVRLSMVNSFDPIGSDDRFVVASIPPEGSGVISEDRRVTISAKRSRLNMDARMDSSVGVFRAFVEGDFAGAGGTENYRLRHAYGQYNKILVGQTWSTFFDAEAIPEEIDFEGLSAQLNTRQPQLRWSGIGKNKNYSFALEDPSPQVSGGEGVSKFADLTGQYTFEKLKNHLRAAAVLRTITGKPEDEEGNQGPEDRTTGWGLSLSGAFKISKRNDLDNLKFQLNGGRGIGRYINDLNSAGGQDASFNPDTGNLDALPAFGGYVAYQRWWANRKILPKFLTNLRTTTVYSYVAVDNYDYQEDDAYRYTQRFSLNIIMSPISAIDLGFEWLWGERINKDGSAGSATQLQFVSTFRF